MLSRRRLAATTIAIVLLARTPAFAAEPALAVGQLWSIKATPAKVLIDRIEPFGERTVVHVTIIDVPTPRGATVFGHAPFDRAALDASIDRLVATDVPIPAEFEAGYARWKADRGGIFTITVDQMIALTLKSLESAHLPPPAPSPAS